MRVAWQRSSVVEQRNHNPLVGGPNPSAATRINKRPDGSFFYSVRRGGEGQPDGGPTRRQKADGRMPVRNANLPRGMKRSGINPSAATKFRPVFRLFLFSKNFPILSEFISFSRLFYIYWT